MFAAMPIPGFTMKNMSINIMRLKNCIEYDQTATGEITRLTLVISPMPGLSAEIVFKWGRGGNRGKDLTLAPCCFIPATYYRHRCFPNHRLSDSLMQRHLSADD
jgi:hypothetical protein